jgi:hypothetical protein
MPICLILFKKVIIPKQVLANITYSNTAIKIYWGYEDLQKHNDSLCRVMNRVIARYSITIAFYWIYRYDITNYSAVATNDAIAVLYTHCLE